MCSGVFRRRLPPSTGTIAPVTHEARSLSSHAATSATSRGSAILPCGVDVLMRSTMPGVAASHVSIICVAVPPGAMPFTRIPSPAQLTAAVSVRLFSARFMAPYAGRAGFARRLPMLDVLTIAPPPTRRMRAASAFMAVQWERKFTANCWSMSSSLVVSSGPGRWIAAPLLKAPSSLLVQCSDAVDGGVDARGVGQVHGDGVGDPALGADLRHDAFEGVGGAGGQHDGGALGGEEPRRGRADTAAGDR